MSADAPEGRTLPQLLRERAERTPDADAVRRKRLGIWHTSSWRELAARVEAVAHGLHGAGLRPGDVLAVVSDNRPEWLVLELAAQSLQARVVGQHPEAGDAETAALLRATGARAVVVEDAVQTTSVLAAAADLPGLALAVCLEARAAAVPAGPVPVRLLADLERAGQDAAASAPAWWPERVALGRPEDLAVLCPLSDASAGPEQLARPRAATLSHRDLVAASRSLTAADPVSARTRYVSVLPLAWSWEQVAGVTGSLRAGYPLSFPESPATQRSDLRDIGPDVLLAPARLWEAMAAELLAELAGAGGARAATWRWAQGLGARRAAGGRLSPLGRLADALVLRAVRDRLGMTRLVHAYSFGAPLRPDVASLFRSTGIDLRRLYGSPDAGPVAVEPRRGGRRPAGDTPGGPAGGPSAAGVGAALPGVELRLDADGEVLVRSAAVATVPGRRTRDAEGWLRTGDLGHLDGDVLVLRGRRDDLLPLGGSAVDPAALEAALRVSPLVEEAVVVALDPPDTGLGVVVVVDAGAAGARAEQRGRPATSLQALAALPEVAELVAEEVARLLRDLPGGSAVRRCVLAGRRLDPALGEVTRGRVVRRAVVAAHLREELAALAQPSGGRGDRGDRAVADVPGASAPVVRTASA